MDVQEGVAIINLCLIKGVERTSDLEVILSNLYLYSMIFITPQLRQSSLYSRELKHGQSLLSLMSEIKSKPR